MPEDHKVKARVLQRMFEVVLKLNKLFYHLLIFKFHQIKALNLQKYCNENIVYYLWRTEPDKIDSAYLLEKKKELNLELERWESYLKEVL